MVAGPTVNENNGLEFFVFSTTTFELTCGFECLAPDYDYLSLRYIYSGNALVRTGPEGKGDLELWDLGLG
jgi:hypothetical protein